MGFDYDKHDNGGESSGNSGSDRMPEIEGDYEYHPQLYRTTYTVVTATVQTIRVLEHDTYGQTLIVGFTNGEVEEGGLYERMYGEGSDPGDPDKAKYKVMSFGELGVDIEERGPDDMEGVKDFHSTYSQDTNFGDTFKWDLIDARHMFDTGAVPEEPITIPGGAFEIYGNASEDNGPTSEAKRLVRLLAENGPDDLRDLNTHDNWVNSDVQLAEELVGDRIRFWTRKEEFKTSDGKTQSYNHLEMEWADSGTKLPVRNSNNRGSTSDDSTEEDTSNSDPFGDDEVEPGDEGGDTPWGNDDSEADTDFSEGMQDVIEYVGKQDNPERSDVETALTKMDEAGHIEPSEYDTEEKVDAVWNAVQAFDAPTPSADD